MTNDKVLVVAAGAIGGFYGALLAKAGAEVSVVCRSDLAEIERHGYDIDSCSLGRWRFCPAQVLSHSGEYRDRADYVILCSKVSPDIDRVKLIEDAVDEKTVIVFIQNGVDIEQELLLAFPDNVIVSGLAFICCSRLSPGVIRHSAYGRLTLGNLPCGLSIETTHLRDLFVQSGLECIASENIMTDRWQKCVWNAPFNPLSVLSGGLSTLEILQNQEALVRCVMQEICEIAAACNHPLPDEIIDANIRSTYAMPPYKTSMLLDFENRRPMETEAILGNALRAARRVDVDCPVLGTLYALMKLREVSLSGESRSLSSN